MPIKAMHTATPAVSEGGARRWTPSGIDRYDPTRGASRPDRYWTTVNSGEATPDVMSPLCWSLWTPLTELGARRAWHNYGIIPRSMVVLPQEVDDYIMATFFGWQAVNVDLVATLMGAVPGSSRELVERSLLGQARPGPSVYHAPRGRLPFIVTLMPLMLVGHTRRISGFHAEMLAWWQRDVLDGHAASGARLLDEAQQRFAQAIYLQARTRLPMQTAFGIAAQLAAAAGAPELVTSVFAGFGGVGELAVAGDLWELAHARLNESTFIRSHGFHGRDQGNVTGVPWRVDAEPIHLLARAMAERPEDDAPRRREDAARARSAEATQQLLAALPASRRALARRVLASGGALVRATERTKAAYTMAIDGVRAAAHLLGANLAARHLISEPEDAAFLTLQELLGEVPLDVAELVAERRRHHAEYRTLILPETFVGSPVPILAAPGPASTPREVLSGAPGSSGRYEGTARVARELVDAADLEDGEILVCHHTDPAWVSAMALADAVVIDVGAPTSHGAIVAREIGIPCVIGTKHGTAVIRTGDRLRVDGTAGTVEILGAG